MANKYYRARISCPQEFKGFRFMDSTSYNNMKEYAKDLRQNGYRTSIIVEITKPTERVIETENTTRMI